MFFLYIKQASAQDIKIVLNIVKSNHINLPHILFIDYHISIRLIYHRLVKLFFSSGIHGVPIRAAGDRTGPASIQQVGLQSRRARILDLRQTVQAVSRAPCHFQRCDRQDIASA